MDQKPKIVLDLDQLTPRDFSRARAALGRDPGELIELHEERTALIIWCVRSRDDPAFTWDQALDTPWSECVAAEQEPDPQPASTPVSNGSSTGSTAKTSSKASRPSATSSA